MAHDTQTETLASSHTVEDLAVIGYVPGVMSLQNQFLFWSAIVCAALGVVGCQGASSAPELSRIKGNFVTVSLRKDIQGASGLLPAGASVQSGDRVHDVYGELIEANDKFLFVRVQAAQNRQEHTTVVPWTSVVAVDAMDAPKLH